MSAPRTDDIGNGIANFVRHYMTAPGVEGAEDESVLWMAAPVRFIAYSGVYRTQFDPATADARINEFIDRFRRHSTRWCWFVPPTASPSDLAERLEARGLVKAVDLTAMAADIDDLAPEPEPIPGLDIRRATTEVEVADYAAIYPKLYDASDESFFADVAEAEGAIFQQGGSATDLYVAYLDGVAVCSGSATARDGLASLDTLSTLAEYRNRGIGAVLALRALADQKAKGADRVVLWAGPGAEKLYERLGFRSHGPVGIYYLPAT